MEDVEGTLRIDMSPEDTSFDGMDSTADNHHSSDKLTLELENHEATSSSVTSFIDQHTVQLEDGSTAYIYQRLNGDMNDQYIDSIDLEDTSAYVHQPSSASALTQTIETKAQSLKCEKDGCVKICPTTRRFKTHKRPRTGEKMYKCEWKDCGKSFSTNYALKSHLRVHTGEKPYGCNYRGCNKAFKTAGDLQKHTRTHTGEKPFKCPFEGCPKAFTTSNILKVHIRTHTGERPYKCPFNDCEKTFSTVTNYNNHVRIHTGEKPFWCDIPGCGKRFTEYSSFYKHQVVHTDRNIYSCCHCGKYYTYSSTLLAHKKTAHNDDSRVIQNSERVRTGRRKRTDGDEVTKLINSANGQSATVEDKLASNNGEDSQVVLLPVDTVDQRSTTVSNEASPQVAAVVTADTGEQLAILSHNGTSQQFTLALTDHGSTILLPSTESNESESSTKSDDQVVYISATDNQRNLMSMIEKDNTLQRIEASENNTSTSDSTPINEDIWLHQPQKDDISSMISVKEETPAKENDSINIHFESSQNPCEDGPSSDSIAYLEIGGAKYQLKIVSAENDTEVDQLCLAHQNETQPATQDVITDTRTEAQSVSDHIKFNELSFLNTTEGSVSDGVPSSPVQYSEGRIDPEGSQRCEPFCKRKNLL